MDEITKYPICVKITLQKDYTSCDKRVIYYRNKLPMFVVEQWRWYFEYLAARLKVKHKRKKVDLIICAQTLLQGDEYKQKKIKDLLVFKKGRLTKLMKEELNPSKNDLFSFQSEDRKQKMEALRKEIESLERGEYHGYVPETYINKIKGFI